MMKELIDREDARIRCFFSHARSIAEKCDIIGKEYYPILNGRRFLTVRQMAERLCLSRRTVFQMIEDRVLPHYRIGGKILLAEHDIEGLLEAGYRPAY